MPESYKKLLESNKNWASKKSKDFFENISKGQNPGYLWIGCSDSRVPANEITGTTSGEVFVHRNIANMVIPTDMSLLSVLQYSVEVLKVKHVIVCGHSKCGGVKVALSNQKFGLIDNWLNNIKYVYEIYRDELDSISNEEEKLNRLIEFNVIHQVINLSKTSIIQNAWENSEYPYLHGFVYNLSDGLLKQIVLIDEPNKIKEIYEDVHM